MGSGFKTFDPGDVLTASDVNNYLMEQSVMSFADSAARTSAIGTANFEEGMLSYLQDEDKYQTYNGTAWVDLAKAAGDPTGLIHIKTQTFSAVSAIKFENVFSSAYKNYRFVADFLSNDATNRSFFARYLVGSTPESGAVYGVTRIRRDFGSTTVTGQNADFNDTAIVWAPAIANTGRASISGDIKLPSVSTRTLIDYSGFIPDSGNFYFYVGSSNIGATTVFDGIEFFIGTPATFSGQISIYGYKD